jgi:hypothetical protein
MASHILHEFIQATHALKQKKSEFTSIRGGLKSEQLALREQLEQALGNTKQVACQSSDGQAIFVNQCSHRQAKTITDEVIRDAVHSVCRQLYDDCTTRPHWRDAIRQRLKERVGESTITVKHYYDVSTKGRGAQASSPASSHIQSLASQLLETKCLLKELNERQKSALDAPQKRLQTLQGEVHTHMSRQGDDKPIRVTNGSHGQADVFLSIQTRAPRTKVTMGNLVQWIDTALNSLDDDCSIDDVAATVLQSVNKHQQIARHRQSGETSVCVKSGPNRR